MTDNMNNILKENENIDDLQINNLKIIQKNAGFKFGIDAVLLSYFVQCPMQSSVIDIGTGTGIIPILLYGKNKGNSFVGIDIQDDMIEMANRSVILNNIQSFFKFVSCDVKDVRKYFKNESFDCLVTNPPYMKVGNGLLNPDKCKAVSRHELTCTIFDIMSAAYYLLKEKGKVYMVHRPHRLPDIFEAMRLNKIEPKRMRFVCPDINKEPNLVLICGVKLGKQELKIDKPLIVYNQDNEYAEEIKEIYGLK